MDTRQRKRHHLHEFHVQKAIKQAVHQAKLTKRVTAYTIKSRALKDA